MPNNDNSIKIGVPNFGTTLGDHSSSCFVFVGCCRPVAACPSTSDRPSPSRCDSWSGPIWRRGKRSTTTGGSLRDNSFVGIKWMQMVAIVKLKHVYTVYPDENLWSSKLQHIIISMSTHQLPSGMILQECLLGCTSLICEQFPPLPGSTVSNGRIAPKRSTQWHNQNSWHLPMHRQASCRNVQCCKIKFLIFHVCPPSQHYFRTRNHVLWISSYQINQGYFLKITIYAFTSWLLTIINHDIPW
jgi:hypothetical protein